MGKKNYELTKVDVRKKFKTTTQMENRSRALESMIRKNYGKKKGLEIRIASQQKEMGILNKMIGEERSEEEASEEETKK